MAHGTSTPDCSMQTLSDTNRQSRYLACPLLLVQTWAPGQEGWGERRALPWAAWAVQLVCYVAVGVQAYDSYQLVLTASYSTVTSRVHAALPNNVYVLNVQK